MRKLFYFFSVTVLFLNALCFNKLSAQQKEISSEFENYDLNHFYGVGKGDGKVVFLGESPMNEATVHVFQDGIIRLYHAPNRYSDKVMSKESIDNGFTWTESKVIFEDSLIWQYPRRTLVDNRGNIHLLVFQERDNDIYHSISNDDGKSWSELHKITDGWIGAIRGFIQTK